MNTLRLGVNIDHVATVRNARGGLTPDPLRAAQIAQAAGADGITAHLREDRRHIMDADIAHLIGGIALPLNLEMAATEEMVAIALQHHPHAACIVPERREEVTTEGGLDAAGQHNRLKPLIARLSDAGIRVSLFIEPDARQIEAARASRRTPTSPASPTRLRSPPRMGSSHTRATALPMTMLPPSPRSRSWPNSTLAIS